MPEAYARNQSVAQEGLGFGRLAIVGDWCDAIRAIVGRNFLAQPAGVSRPHPITLSSVIGRSRTRVPVA